MTRHIDHDEAYLTLGALALDAVDASERAVVMTHIADCAICRGELESLRGTASNLAFAAPLAADSSTASRARVRDRLTTRATAEGQARRLANPPILFPKGAETPAQATPARSFHPVPMRRHPAEYIALAAGVMFVISLVGLIMSWSENLDLKDKIANVPGQDLHSRHVADSLAKVLASRDSILEGIAERDVVMMTLTSRTARESYARVFWDRQHHGWTLLARNMPALKPGRTYQLWLVTSKATVSAGTFTTVDGDAEVRATYGVAPENLRAVAITEEPAGGVAQPTGNTILSVTMR